MVMSGDVEAAKLAAARAFEMADELVARLIPELIAIAGSPEALQQARIEWVNEQVDERHGGPSDALNRGRLAGALLSCAHDVGNPGWRERRAGAGP